jgi:hypothetical protein
MILKLRSMTYKSWTLVGGEDRGGKGGHCDIEVTYVAFPHLFPSPVKTILGRGDVMTKERVDANSRLHANNRDMIIRRTHRLLLQPHI